MSLGLPRMNYTLRKHNGQQRDGERQPLKTFEGDAATLVVQCSMPEKGKCVAATMQRRSSVWDNKEWIPRGSGSNCLAPR